MRRRVVSFGGLFICVAQACETFATISVCRSKTSTSKMLEENALWESCLGSMSTLACPGLGKRTRMHVPGRKCMTMTTTFANNLALRGRQQHTIS